MFRQVLLLHELGVSARLLRPSASRVLPTFGGASVGGAETRLELRPPPKARQQSANDSLRRQIISLVEEQRGAEAATVLLGAPVSDVEPSTIAAVLHACGASDEVFPNSQGSTSEDAAFVDRIIHGVVRTNERFWTESVLSQWLRQQCRAEDWDGATQTVSYLRTKFGPLKKRSLTPYLRLACQLRKRAYAEAVVRESAVDSTIVELDDEDVRNLAAMYLALGEPLSTLHGLLSLVAPYLSHLSRMTAMVLLKWKDTTTTASPSVSQQHLTHVSHAGVCPLCGSQLVGCPFTTVWKTRLLEDIERTVRTLHPIAASANGKQGSASGSAAVTNQRTKKDPVRHEAAVRSFRAWKRFVNDSPVMREVDVLIDGANVGYYGLSSWYGVVKAQLREFRALHYPNELRRLHTTMEWSKSLPYVDVPVSMEMILEAVRVTTERGWKPLVLLHERHVERHNLFPSAEAAVHQLRERSQLYTTPAGLNDDLCWLYGAVSCTTPTDDAALSNMDAADHHRGPQRRHVFILTNDKMRDHHFRFLSPKPFSSWRNRHRVGFRCIREDGVTRMELSEPPGFTETLQHDPVTRAWHIPVAKPVLEDNVTDSGSSCSSEFAAETSKVGPTVCDGVTTSTSLHYEVPDDGGRGLHAADVTEEWLCLRQTHS